MSNRAIRPSSPTAHPARMPAEPTAWNPVSPNLVQVSPPSLDQVRPRRPDRHQGRTLRPGQVGDGGAVAAGSRALRRPPAPAAVRGDGGDPIRPPRLLVVAADGDPVLRIPERQREDARGAACPPGWASRGPSRSGPGRCCGRPARRPCRTRRCGSPWATRQVPLAAKAPSPGRASGIPSGRSGSTSRRRRRSSGSRTARPPGRPGPARARRPRTPGRRGSPAGHG